MRHVHPRCPRSRRRSRWTVALLPALAAALLLGACGGASTRTAAADTGQSAGIRYSECMRRHGVPNFPDPSGGAISITPGAGIDPRSPSFRSASRACVNYEPAATPRIPQMTAALRRAALRFAQCMRSHGVPNFPDPQQGTAGSATPTLVLHGMQFGGATGIDPSSPAFGSAATACGLPRRGG